MYRKPTDVYRPARTFYNSIDYNVKKYNYKNKPYHFTPRYNNYKNKKIYVQSVRNNRSAINNHQTVQTISTLNTFAVTRNDTNIIPIYSNNLTNVTINECLKITALIDTGASTSVISEKTLAADNCVNCINVQL